MLNLFWIVNASYLYGYAKCPASPYPLFGSNLMISKGLPEMPEKYELESMSIGMNPGLPNGKENRGVGGGSWPHGHGRKVEFSSPTLGSGLPCPSTLYTPP